MQYTAHFIEFSLLTDGAFNLTAEKGRSRDDNDTEHIDVSVLQTMLEEIVGIKNGGGFKSTGIKVQYLGIGKAEKVEENKDCNLHAKLSTATSLKDDLVKICNDIFKRSELPSKFINGNEITINLSMRNVIVFAQGEGATISGLKTPGGDDVDDVSDSGQRKYSEISAWWGDTNKHAIDTSLAGQVVTFSACPTSTEPYILECIGAEKVQVFYEPDVEIELSLIGGTDDNGNPVKVDITSGEVNPGEYTVEYKIVDAVTKEDAVKSGLMGNSIEFSESYIENSKGKKEFKSGDKVTFEPDEETEIVVTGTYLEDYTISTKDNPWAFPKFKVNPPEIKTYDVKLSTAQANNWYVKKDQANWKPIIAELTVDGAPLSDEELEKVNFSLEFSPEMTYSKKMIPGKSAYEIYLCATETGADVTPETGSYTVKAKAVFTDEHGREFEREDKLGFNIELYSVIWRWLIWIILLLAILLLIWFILSRKAWPKNMRFESTNSSKKAKISVNKTINIVSNAYPGVLPCSAEKNSTLYHRSKRTASVKITKVTPSFKVVSFRIGGSPTYTKENGVYRDSNGKEFSPIVVRNNTKVIVEIKGGMPIEGIVYINSRKK